MKAKAVGTEFADVIVWHDIAKELSDREISKTASRVADRATKGDTVRAIAEPGAWAPRRRTWPPPTNTGTPPVPWT